MTSMIMNTKTINEEDLLQLPSHEDQFSEYKGSAIQQDKLITKIQIAASAFWNSGGGRLYIGIDKAGKIDGGIALQVGGQSRLDWIDQAISRVQPQAKYQTHAIQREKSDSLIQPNSGVFVIEFAESSTPPHMSPSDNAYYIRTGAHSVPASHFIVEALRSKRVQSPLLRVMPRIVRRKNDVIQIAVVAATIEPAIDVLVNFSPLPKSLEDADRSFPIQIPIIDRANPFSMDIAHYIHYEDHIGTDGFDVNIDFADLAGRTYSFSETIRLDRQLTPYYGGREVDNVVDAIEKLVKAIKK